MTAGVLFGSSVALFGFDAWRSYLEVVGSHQKAVLLEKFHGFYTHMMVSVFADLRGLGIDYRAALAVQVAVAVPVVGLACWAVRRTADPCRRALVLACAMPLLTPYAFNYDLTSMTAALVWVLPGNTGIGTLPLVALFVLSVREVIRPPAEPVAGSKADFPGETPHFAGR